MIPSARAAALRSTALATSLALAIGLSAFPVEAWAKPKVPLPKPRPIARSVVPKTTANTAATYDCESPGKYRRPCRDGCGRTGAGTAGTGPRDAPACRPAALRASKSRRRR